MCQLTNHKMAMFMCLVNNGPLKCHITKANKGAIVDKKWNSTVVLPSKKKSVSVSVCVRRWYRNCFVRVPYFLWDLIKSKSSVTWVSYPLILYLCSPGSSSVTDLLTWRQSVRRDEGNSTCNFILLHAVSQACDTVLSMTMVYSHYFTLISIILMLLSNLRVCISLKYVQTVWLALKVNVNVIDLTQDPFAFVVFETFKNICGCPNNRKHLANILRTIYKPVYIV